MKAQKENNSLNSKLRNVVEGDLFNNVISAIIVLNCIVIAVQTVPLDSSISNALNLIDAICLGIYVAEIVLKILVLRSDFFKTWWNLFDFVIVALALVPASIIPVPVQAIRIFRVFRAARALLLVSTFKPLRLIVESIVKSLPKIVWTAILLAIISYIYALVGFYLYGEAYPEYFGDLAKSAFTLFQLSTLENWADVAREVMQGEPWSSIYFITYVLIAAFIVVNVVVAIIVNTMEEVIHKHAMSRTTGNSNLDEALRGLQEDLEKVQYLISEEYKESED